MTRTLDLGSVSPGYAVVGAGGIWITDFHGDTVIRIDPATGAVLGTVAVGTHPLDTAFGFGSAWITNLDGGSVSRVDPGTGRVMATIPVGGGELQGLATGLGSVWVASVAGDEIWEIDPGTDRVVGVIRGVGGPREVVVVRGELWTTASGDGTLDQLQVDA
ncbi:MAG TPA: hypothetical protein VEN82_06850 [Actinomycetota bacterium]|nr:hypothetical protein [Actinomycetota bacterium]